MPVRAERSLKKYARRKGLTGARRRAYVYGTLAKIKKAMKKKRRKKQK